MGLPAAASGSTSCHVLAAAASGVTAFIRGAGADPDLVLGEAGFDPRDLEDPRATVPLARYVAMMERAAARSGDSHFGLRFGQQFQPEALGLIGELALAAPDVGTGLAAFARHFIQHQQNTETRLAREGRSLRLEYRIVDPRIWSRRQDAELTMGMFANLLRRALGGALEIEEVWFEHPAPEQAQAHAAAFGAPVFFAATANAISFRAAGLERPMPARDPARFAALAEELRRIGGGGAPRDLLGAVTSEIRRLLPEGPAGIDRVAASLGLPRWTLQRRLAEHGITYSECIDQVRARLALMYLAEPHLSIAAVAELLGYSEVSAFSRACRRLHGASPETVRRKLGARAMPDSTTGRPSPAHTA
ncbi:AraC-like transcriptional regulator QhpR [Acidiphilium multivorum]|nr:AraC family transcriptional regulator [Acidiphilium multivorum]MBS3024958.1 AraC family transcriptional regulator [Acidiphilium multivorum]